MASNKLFAFVILFVFNSCSEVEKNVILNESPVNLAKIKVLKTKDWNSIYIFGLIENKSEDTIYLFTGLDQINCQLDSFQYKNGDYSYEIICSILSPTKLDLFTLKPQERHWFYLDSENFTEDLNKVVSARITIFWASDNDTAWCRDNKYLNRAIFRKNINIFEQVNRLPYFRGFEDIEMPNIND